MDISTLITQYLRLHLGCVLYLLYSTECSGLELEYFNMVKNTFDVPGKSIKNEQTSPLGRNGTLADGAEFSVTAFGLTVLVISIIGFVLIVAISYFAYNMIASVFRYVLLRREKQRKVSCSDTETSSLDSNIDD